MLNCTGWAYSAATCTLRHAELLFTASTMPGEVLPSIINVGSCINLPMSCACYVLLQLFVLALICVRNVLRAAGSPHQPLYTRALAMSVAACMQACMQRGQHDRNTALLAQPVKGVSWRLAGCKLDPHSVVCHTACCQTALRSAHSECTCALLKLMCL